MDPHTPSTRNFCWQFLLLTEIQFGTFPAKNPPASQGRSTDGIGDRWSALGLFDVERWAFGDFQRPWYLQGRSSVVFVFCFVFFLRINLLNPSWKGEWTYRSRFLKIAFTFEWSGSWGLKDGEWIQNVFYMENFRCNFCRLPFERQINSTAHLVATVILNLVGIPWRMKSAPLKMRPFWLTPPTQRFVLVQKTVLFSKHFRQYLLQRLVN